ncbi:uncharacterized protein LOC105848342 [Hydra vulgaris]|uniref:uncharacterized protein LOC105848342 n=1 Tax=Hydra vulgaris TaxID=6087 RepID=UPI001F5FCE40|nr:uncharacterized protein LOC105848342 [Hydra vulgaris]
MIKKNEGVEKEDINDTVLLDIYDYTLKELIPIIKLRITFKKDVSILKKLCTEVSCSGSLILSQSSQSVVDFNLPILNSTSSGKELILPNFLMNAISSKELNFDVPGKSKLKTSFLDVLFDVIKSRYGLYPSSSQLYELAHEVIVRFPNVKPTHGNGSGSSAFLFTF